MNTDLKIWLSSLILLVTVTAVHAQTHLAEVHASAGTDSVTVPDSAPTKRSFFKKFSDYFNNANKERKNKEFDLSAIGESHYPSDTKLGLGLMAARLYRTDRNDTILPPSDISLYGDVSTVGLYLLGIHGMHPFPHDKYRLNYNLYFCPSPSLYWKKGYDNGANNADESDYDRFQVQMRVDLVFRPARNLHVGPMTVSDYIYGHNIEKSELWGDMNACTTSFSLGLPLFHGPRDLLTNAYKGYYLKIDQRLSPTSLGNKYVSSSTELDTRYYHEVWRDGVLAG